MTPLPPIHDDAQIAPYRAFKWCAGSALLLLLAWYSYLGVYAPWMGASGEGGLSALFFSLAFVGLDLILIIVSAAAVLSRRKPGPRGGRLLAAAGFVVSLALMVSPGVRSEVLTTRPLRRELYRRHFDDRAGLWAASILKRPLKTIVDGDNSWGLRSELVPKWLYQRGMNWAPYVLVVSKGVPDFDSDVKASGSYLDISFRGTDHSGIVSGGPSFRMHGSGGRLDLMQVAPGTYVYTYPADE